MYLEPGNGFIGDSQDQYSQTREFVQLSDSHCCARVETASGAWLLEATHAGKVHLEFNGVPLAKLSSLVGSAMLREGGCPFDRAEQILIALCARSSLRPSSLVRDELEYALARWIPTYFDP